MLLLCKLDCMSKMWYESPKAELLPAIEGLDLLLNLSLESDIEDFEGEELDDF